MRTRTAAAIVAAVTIAIYWRALHAGFVGDDVMILHRLRALNGPWPVLRLFRGAGFQRSVKGSDVCLPRLSRHRRQAATE